MVMPPIRAPTPVGAGLAPAHDSLVDDGQPQGLPLQLHLKIEHRIGQQKYRSQRLDLDLAVVDQNAG